MAALTVVVLCLTALPTLLFLINLRLYRPAPPALTTRPVSVLIPARNEEACIAAAVESALSSRGVEVEVIVLDDHSGDGTADVVRGLAQQDSRVRLEEAPPLPAGWCGKQHACHVLASLARHDLLVF